MSFLSDLRLRFSAMLFRHRVERDLDEELETHLELETDARRRAGLPPEEARRQALLAFGGVERWKEATRDARGLALWDGLVLDLRQSMRTLRRQPGFTFAVILVLGLAVGVSTAVFSVVRTVLFSELPYPDAGRLLRVYQQNSPDNRFGLSTVDVQAILAEQHSFEAFGVVQASEAALSGTGSPERVVIGRATAGFFRAIGLGPYAGRLIAPEDERHDAPAVAVVTFALAERTLGGADRALGRSITLDGVSHTVVGVLPRGYQDLAGLQAVAWPALRLDPPTRRGPFRFRGIGRLRPGVTLADATADLSGISERIFPVWATSFRDQRARLTPYSLRRTIVGDTGRGLLLLAGAVTLVLLVAIANVATLLMVRTAGRRTELAVRTALGAGRARLARLLLTESGVLMLGVGAVGLFVAMVCIRLLQHQADPLPRIAEVALDPATLLVAALLVLGSGMLVTLSPILSLRRERLERPVSVRTGADPALSRARSLLVAGEFAVALPLLVGAGLLLNSFMRLSRVNPGFDPRGVTTVDVALPPARYPDPAAVQRFLTLAESRAAELPGVNAAGLSTAMPPDDPGDVNNFDLLDHPVPEGTSEPVAAWSAVTPGYFTTLQVPLLEGRLFQPGDTGAAPVIIVSRSWASKYYPGVSAIGRQLYSGGCRSCPPSTVIGVVGDVKYLGLSGSAEAVYQPVAQAGPQRVNLMVRSSNPASREALTAAIAALDPELPLRPVRLEDRVHDSLSDPRRWTTLVMGFALSAAALAALGVYGLMAYLVRNRQREIGVRIALGAEPTRVAREVTRRGMGYAVAGSAVGLTIALAGGRWMEQMLFGISSHDPATLVAVVLLLLGVALVSCWLPGRRAAKVNLTAALGAGE
ncbi:MAG TPA: ABC transporter permease [Gemmatimonadales bacterium]|nr:ABC transporter permease [Gemmatimonadales bacterium]